MEIKKYKILIIDDDPVFFIAAKASLEEAGFQVALAPNGSEGFESAKTEKPDLIILDIIMPKENGLLTLDRLKNDETLSKIPIIISTNLEKAHLLVKDKGVASFILKSQSNILELVNKAKEILIK